MGERNKVSNTNCLEGMRCPECGALEPFTIFVKTAVRMWDDGSEDTYGDQEWDDGSYCMCDACTFSGMVMDFRVKSDE